MKILFITHRFSPDIGGIEINAEILASAFLNAGNEVRLLTWSNGIPTRVFPYQVIRSPNKVRLIQEHKWADVIFENNPCLRLSWPNLFFGHHSIVAIRALISWRKGSMNFQARLKFAWLKRANAVIAVSDSIRKTCWPEATVIGNPYRVNDFKQLPAIKRTIDFVFLGRLVSQKGVDQAIMAVHHLLTSSDMRKSFLGKPILTIIGDGPERAKLERLVADLKLTTSVQFTGSLSGEELVTCLNRHKYLLVPSVFEEAFGNVVLEGMACGCLPIVSDCGGLPDAVGKAGMTFKSGDLNALISCINKLLDNPELEQQLRKAARKHLESHHPNMVAAKYLNVINSITKKPC